MVQWALVQRRWHRYFRELLRLKARYGRVIMTDDWDYGDYLKQWRSHHRHLIEELRIAGISTNNCESWITVLLPMMTRLRTIRVTQFPRLENWSADKWLTTTAARLTHLELTGTSVVFSILHHVGKCRYLGTLVLDISPGTAQTLLAPWNVLTSTPDQLRAHLLDAVTALTPCTRLSQVTLRSGGDLFTDATLLRLVATLGQQLQLLRLESCGAAVSHEAVLQTWDACPRLNYLSLTDTGRVHLLALLRDVQGCTRRCSAMCVSVGETAASALSPARRSWRSWLAPWRTISRAPVLAPLEQLQLSR